MVKYYRRRRSRRPKSALQAVRALARRVPRKRLKFTNQLIAETSANNSWSFMLINAVSQGDLDSQRDGDSIVMQNLHMHCKWTTSAAIDATASCRMMVVYDRQPNGAAFVTADLMEVNNSIIAHTDPKYDKRFSVLYDKLFSLNEYAANTAVTSDRAFSSWISIKGRKTQYSGAGGTIAEISTGSLYFIYLSDRAASPPLVTAGFQLKYYSSQN